MSDDFIPYEAIPARIAEVRQFEADYPEFCKPAVEFTPEQHATARAYAAALMSDYSPGMTDGGARMEYIRALDKAQEAVAARRETRIAATVIRSGRIGLGQDPYNWYQ
jgi:hypothetical protein